MIPIARPAATLALVLSLASCGGDPERDALRAYEAAVEKLMEEEGKVTARLVDLREDLRAGGAAGDEQAAYGRDEALPFYERFKAAAARAPAGTERLRGIHARLLEYADRRTGYLKAVDAFLAGTRSEGMERLKRGQGPRDAAVQELKAAAEKTGGDLGDAAAADAYMRLMMFIQKKYDPFQQGTLPLEDVEAALRNDVLPRLQSVADRTRDRRTAEGPAGAIARWSAAELAFMQELAATLPQQVVLQEARTTSLKAWDESVALREKYLADLRAYRESLR
jgi:hypothetical protein